jgi:hypothetical protein
METKMTEVAKSVTPPTHIIWQVIGEARKARWIRVGAGWTNRDGKGMNLMFDAYPMVGRTVIREVAEPEAGIEAAPDAQ